MKKLLVSLAIAAAACGEASSGPARSRGAALIDAQGQQMQGQQMQGQQMQGTGLTGGGQPVTHRLDGWTKNYKLRGAWLSKGELFGTAPDGRTLSGAALVGTLIPTDQGGWSQIMGVQQDPTFPEGGTSLYTVDQVAADGTHTPLCRTDATGTSAAIPVAAIFDATGARVESATSFTFACTAGVIAKCYRWGYRPWLDDATTGGAFARLHLACTRMARADYCGDGRSWTYDGTLINLWDYAPAPGPFNTHGTPPPDFVFEAGWSSKGAVCLSKQRWVTAPPELAAACPDRLIAPGATLGNATVCDSASEAPGAVIFDESRLNVR